MNRLNTLLLLIATTVLSRAQSDVFTVQIGSAPTPPSSLVRHEEIWHYHKGTNAPQAGWKTIADDALDTTWNTGPGGFGYEDGDDATVLSDMLGFYTTVYIRKSFATFDPIDPAAHLFLRMDWDDGFIAWLDGTEIARSPNAPGTVGTEPPNTAISNPPNHNSSGDPAPMPAVTYDLGLASARLTPGVHVLAVMGLNGGSTSSDLSLIADLTMSGSSGAAVQGTFVTIVQTNQIAISGTNTFANSTRVTVNGLNANFTPGSGTWSRNHMLNPGMNRLFIAAHDAQGNILAATTRDVVAELKTVLAGGTIVGNTSWYSSNGVVRVTNNLVVANGGSLSIGEGTVVLIGGTLGVSAGSNGAIMANGSYENPIFFLPADGSTPWREISANATNGALTLRHSETIAGQIRAANGGTTLVEDCTARDLTNGVEIVLGLDGAGLTLRRSHLLHYSEVDSRRTPFIAEDCLLERISVDGLDIKDHPTLIVRRCTLRHGAVNSGVADADGVDLGPGLAPLVESCLFHDFDDKGVSIGDSTPGTIVRNCLFYNCAFGISAYGSTNCVLDHNTIYGCGMGISFRRESGIPGTGTGTNQIVWNNITNVAVLGGAVLNLSYSDVQGGFSGTGNIDSDPLFVNAAAKDFHLTVQSPAVETGLAGSNMGVAFPVGGIPPTPWNLAVLIDGTNALQLTWQEDADNEVAFVIERSTNAVNWEYLGFALPNHVSYTDVSAETGKTYFYRVRAENSSGISHFSNLASGTRETPITFVGGRLSNNTTWSPALGVIIVQSNVTVPTNVTLTIQAGALIKLTNNVGITAQAGGAIHIEGTAEAPVVLQRWNGTNNWSEIRAEGTNASLVIRHADISGGQTTVYNGATGLLEDSYFHDFFQQGAGTIFNQPIILTHFSAGCMVRRCIVRNYHETLWRHGVNVVEDSLFEDMLGDALDFDAAVPGSTVRRCTFRHGNRTNVDAIDIGNDGTSRSAGVRIESCLMYDFPLDKGISIGEISSDIVVSNCLMYNCIWGVGVKDSSTVGLFNNTISTCEVGFRLYHKTDPGSGLVTNAFNNILWGNTNSVLVLDGGAITLDFSDLQETIWPGTGNISADPLFLNGTQRDYRLAANSPCIGTGHNGDTMGAHFPVGAVIAPSHPYFTSVKAENGEAVLRFWADNEKTYTAQKSASVSGSWIKLTNVTPGSIPKLAEVREPLVAGETRFYRIVTPALP